ESARGLAHTTTWRNGGALPKIAQASWSTVALYRFSGFGVRRVGAGLVLGLVSLRKRQRAGAHHDLAERRCAAEDRASVLEYGSPLPLFRLRSAAGWCWVGAWAGFITKAPEGWRTPRPGGTAVRCRRSRKR